MLTSLGSGPVPALPAGEATPAPGARRAGPLPSAFADQVRALLGAWSADTTWFQVDAPVEDALPTDRTAIATDIDSQAAESAVRPRERSRAESADLVDPAALLDMTPALVTHTSPLRAFHVAATPAPPNDEAPVPVSEGSPTAAGEGSWLPPAERSRVPSERSSAPPAAPDPAPAPGRADIVMDPGRSTGTTVAAREAFTPAAIVGEPTVHLDVAVDEPRAVTTTDSTPDSVSVDVPLRTERPMADPPVEAPARATPPVGPLPLPARSLRSPGSAERQAAVQALHVSMATRTDASDASRPPVDAVSGPAVAPDSAPAPSAAREDAAAALRAAARVPTRQPHGDSEGAPTAATDSPIVAHHDASPAETMPAVPRARATAETTSHDSPASRARAEVPFMPAAAPIAPAPALAPEPSVDARGTATGGVPVREPELADQMIHAVRLQVTQGGGEARIQLRPEYLGELSLRVVVEDGRVTAQLDAAAPAVREWIERHEGTLRQALAEHGLTLETLQVSEAGTEESGDSSERGTGSGREADERPRRRRPRAQPDGARFEVDV